MSVIEDLEAKRDAINLDSSSRILKVVNNYINDQLKASFEELKTDIEEIMKDQNDINENTRFRLDMIERALAELQPKDNDRSRKIGFKQNADV